MGATRTVPALQSSFVDVQVAAVCYRRKSRTTQFLLVRASSGRWTFPKGHVEPGLSHAAVAALEAFEEAGVTGKVDPQPFGVYLHKKSSLAAEVRVHTFLLEVRRARSPQEIHRVPRWFSPKAAKKKLARRRRAKYHRTLLRVIDRAVEQIARRER